MLRRLFLQLLYSPFFSKWLILETSIISALFHSHQILHSLNRISKLAPKSVSYHYSSGNKFVVHILYMTMNNLHCYLTSKRFLHNCCGSRNLSSPHCLPSLSANLVNSSYYHYCFPQVCQKCSWLRLIFRSWGSLLHVLTHFFFLWILRYSCPWHFADGFFVKAIMSQGSSCVLFLSSSSENKTSRKRIGNVSMLLFFSTFSALLTVKVSPFVFRLFTNKLHIRSSRF